MEVNWPTSPLGINTDQHPKVCHEELWIKYGYGSISIFIAFLGEWTSINPSYFDVNYRGTRFWHTAIYETFKTTSQILTSKPRLCQPPHLIKYGTILYRLSSTLFEFQSSPSSSSWNPCRWCHSHPSHCIFVTSRLRNYFLSAGQSHFLQGIPLVASSYVWINQKESCLLAPPTSSECWNIPKLENIETTL